MAYPLKVTQTIPSSDTAPPAASTLLVPFRPAKPGLINVIVTGVGIIPPPPPPHSGENDPPPVPVLSLRLELLKPGNPTPVLSKTVSERLKAPPIVRDRVVASGGAMAAASEVAADWTVRVTNIGNVPATCNVTVRYQTMDGNLGKIDHIVVLMMENRSFDQMLGYLSLEKGRTDVDGLKAADFNRDAHDTRFNIKPFPDVATRFKFDPGHGWPDAYEQLEGDKGVGLASNAGFVKNFAAMLAKAPRQSPQHDSTTITQGDSHTIRFRPVAAGPIGVRTDVSPTPNHSESGFLGQLTIRRPGSSTPLASTRFRLGANFMTLTYVATAADLAVTGDWTCEVANLSDVLATFTTDIANASGLRDPTEIETPDAIMNYHNAAHLPVYDMLAQNFLICDRWHASLPTDTWPNRLYALTGGSGGLDTTPSTSDVEQNPPGYLLKTIFEVLQEHGVDWMIYFADLPYPLIFKKLAQDASYTARMRSLGDFMQRAETGDLPAVTWLDPNFSDVPDDDQLADDDHPPHGDVKRGQQLVGQIYNALAQSPAWPKTMFVITYDEHGGFYDHVRPPGTPAHSDGTPSDPNDPPAPDGPADDNPRFRRYGVRVPALVVSPWVAPKTVSKTIYDHTSLLRTILLRFCVEAEVNAPPGVMRAIGVGAVGATVGGVVVGGPTGPHVPSMGARTDHANDLAGVLSLNALPATPPPQAPTVPPPPPAARAAFDPKQFGAVLRRAVLGF
jgi:phospholipase C